jgi:hypothetical protein
MSRALIAPFVCLLAVGVSASAADLEGTTLTGDKTVAPIDTPGLSRIFCNIHPQMTG